MALKSVVEKLILLLTFCVSLFSLNSCREDGDWGNDNVSQFGFTIERDNNFIEKAVGETNQLNFNIVPNYDFSSIQTILHFKTVHFSRIQNINDCTLQ